MTSTVEGVMSHVRQELEKTIVGQGEVVDLLLLTRRLRRARAARRGARRWPRRWRSGRSARILRLQFQRVQCTPDLMPADIVGANVLQHGDERLRAAQGPVFTDLLLVDEINRMPPRTQAALLEAMEERQVTIDGTSHRLSPAFTAFATQNPVEFEGTYPLPEARARPLSGEDSPRLSRPRPARKKPSSSGTIRLRRARARRLDLAPLDRRSSRRRA